jgi:hypothetical protein
MLRSQTPFFKVCHNCGKHGKIVYPDGTCSEIVLYKEQGIEFAGQARRNGYITQFEYGLICEQINKSNLLDLQTINIILLSGIKEIELAEKIATKIGCEIFYGRPMN